MPQFDDRRDEADAAVLLATFLTAVIGAARGRSGSTGDNAGSLTAILAAWDTAGYLPDRAMQEDIRYSTTLPVERMSIRDTSTIDGMLHLTVTGTCAEPAR